MVRPGRAIAGTGLTRQLKEAGGEGEWGLKLTTKTCSDSTNTNECFPFPHGRRGHLESTGLELAWPDCRTFYCEVPCAVSSKKMAGLTLLLLLLPPVPVAVAVAVAVAVTVTVTVAKSVA